MSCNSKNRQVIWQNFFFLLIGPSFVLYLIFFFLLLMILLKSDKIGFGLRKRFSAVALVLSNVLHYLINLSYLSNEIMSQH